MNILCNKGDLLEKSVNEGDLGLPRGRLVQNKGASPQMGERWQLYIILLSGKDKWQILQSYRLILISCPLKLCVYWVKST